MNYLGLALFLFCLYNQNLTDDDKKKSDKEKWEAWLQKYSERLEREEEGLSKEEVEDLNMRRVDMMNKTNPKFILRNYIAQNAIEAAENGDYSEVKPQTIPLPTHPLSPTFPHTIPPPHPHSFLELHNKTQKNCMRT